MPNNLTILGIAGSLRKDSYNKKALLAAQAFAPDGITIEIADIAGIPVFNQDDEANVPAQVTAFKKQIEAADAILFVTPEYNYSVPGALKNAIDWASRPYGSNSFDGKPAAIMGASPGRLGSARAQYHLRQICVFLNVQVVNQPEVMISSAHEAFNEDGTFSSEVTAKLVHELLGKLADMALGVGR